LAVRQAALALGAAPPCCWPTIGLRACLLASTPFAADLLKPAPQIMYNSRKMHKPKEKWRSREYGFVDFATIEEANAAVAGMGGLEVPELCKDSSGIIVQFAKPTAV
jgi:hypothetical protein